MRHLGIGIWLGALCLTSLLTTACSTTAAQRMQAAPIGTGLPIAPVAARMVAMTATPNPTPTPDPAARVLVIWWPAPLYPDAKNPAADLLTTQIKQYETSSGHSVALRLKRAEGLGGIYQTLYNGRLVAPSVMPDLTLLRRSDLIKAAAGKLIYPIDSSSLNAPDLFTSGVQLGQIQGTQYGIPYALEVQHLAYRADTLQQTPHTLNDLLSVGQPYLFPAAKDRGIAVTFLAQYLAAGGRLADPEGKPILDREPLLNLLTYYEQAAKDRTIGPQVLDYITPGQYWSTFASGKVNIMQIDSTTYLIQQSAGIPVSIAPIPAINGPSQTVMDAWLWVVTAADPDRQARALTLIAWLSDAQRQSPFTLAIGVLPSRRSALEAWKNVKNNQLNQYIAFAEPLLSGIAAPPPDTLRPAVAAALQNALEDVLSGRKSAAVAADDALMQVAKITEKTSN